MADLLRKI